MSGAQDAAPVLPAGYSAVFFDEIDSTNEEARRRAEAGGPDGLWILARRQTAGRGRRGRSWETGDANFAGTLLLRPRGAPARIAQFSFVAALAVADALAEFGLTDARLKWPNDVLVGGAKISGILLESASASTGGVGWLAVGIGINLAAAPDGLAYPVTSLRAEGLPPPSPGRMLEKLAAHWARWTDLFAADGFTPIREAWLARAAFLGGEASGHSRDRDVSGRFIDLDEDGALILDTAQGRAVITSGEVTFAR